MKEQDKKEIRQIFNEGFEQLILPHLDRIYKGLDGIRGEMATKKELQDRFEHLDQRLDSLDRKLIAEVEWRDGASKRLKKVEIKLGLVE